MTKDVEWARLWVKETAKSVGENREYLIDLDRQIGDGDHGENLDRGFSAVVRGAPLDDAQTGSEIMKYVAKTLMSTVGGAAGPLYGTAFLRGAGQFPAEDLTATDIAQILEAAVGGVQARGKAETGEKTMVDALQPAAAAARQAATNGESVRDALHAAAAAGRQGAESTEAMKATKGRASYLGDRSIGHLDPGAVSSALLLEAAARAADSVYGADQ